MKLDKKFAEALTNALVDKIKAIDVDHWEQPWFNNVKVSPQNLDGLPYRGLNKVLLSWLGGHREIPVFLTFLRAKKEGLSILSGERSIPIQYGSKVAYKDGKSISIEKYNSLGEDEKADYKVSFMMKHYNVFAIEQTNIKEINPELYERLKEESIAQSRAITVSDKPLDTLVEQQGWYTPIRLDQVTEAFYRPSTDSIHLPKREYFKSDDLYHSTMLHEMAHSTGHKDRLNRNMEARFGSEKYGKEELVAELSSAIVGQHYGISKTILERNAHYLHNWLNAIRQEPEFLNEVFEDVLNASDMIVDKIEQEIELSTSSKMNNQTITIKDEIVPIAEIYAREQLMTTEEISKRDIGLPPDIMSAVEQREQILKELEVTYDIEKERELLAAKMRLEDNIRESLQKYVVDKYQFSLPPYISYEEKQKTLAEVKEYAPKHLSEERLLHEGLYGDFPVQITIPNTSANRKKLSVQDIEYEDLSSKELTYKGLARVREGYTLDNTQTNRDFLEQNSINYDIVRGRNLFVPMKAQKAALLLSSSLLFSPVVGIALMYVLNKSRAIDKILVNKPFSKAEATQLNNGKTIRKSITENGHNVDKYYFIDNRTYGLRSIPVNEVHLPNRVNGVSLSPNELDDLRHGKKVVGYDENSKMYYEAQLDLNNRSAIKMGFKDLKAEKEFKYVPKPNSPDAEKIAYVQVHGAQGVNDIWEMGGVNLERDSFLDKYDVEGFYKDYLSANQDKDQARAKELSESIQNNVSRQESLGISR